MKCVWSPGASKLENIKNKIIQPPKKGKKRTEHSGIHNYSSIKDVKIPSLTTERSVRNSQEVLLIPREHPCRYI